MKNINLNSDFVATSANVADQPVSILTATVPDKMLFVLSDNSLLRLDLQTSVNTQISANTSIYLAKKKVTQVLGDVFFENDYSAYNAINVSSGGYPGQLDEDNQNQLFIQVSTGTGKIGFLEGEQLQLIIDSPDIVSIADSKVSFKVEERPYRPQR